MPPPGSETRDVPEPEELEAALPPTLESASLSPENVVEGFSSPADVSGSGLGESQRQDTASSSAQTPDLEIVDDEGPRTSLVESTGSFGEAATLQALPSPETAADGLASDWSPAQSEQGDLENSESGALLGQPEGGGLVQASTHPEPAVVDPQDQASSSAEGAAVGQTSQEEGATEQASPLSELGSADPDERASPSVESDPLGAPAEEGDDEAKSEPVGASDDKPVSKDEPSPSEVRHDVRAGQVYTKRMRQGVAIFCSLLGLTTFLLSTVLTYQIALPGIQHMFFKSLLISNETDGFNSQKSVSYGLYKSWYFWNITNQKMYTNGSQPPTLQQVGPYTMQQVVKINDVNFVEGGVEVLRSTTVYGIYAPERSCAACSLDDSLTVVNEVFMATIDSQFNNDPIALLQAYVPGLIADALRHIEAYILNGKKPPTPAAATQLARQQFRLCNVVDSKKNVSIKKVDSTYKLQYNPEYCAWATANKVKYAPTTMTAAELDLLFSLIFADVPNPVATVVKLINPRVSYFQRLSWLRIELSIGILEYLNYLVKYLAQQFFTQTVVQNNGGLIVTRTVRELLYGYYDPWLESIHGNRSAKAWVTQIHTQQEVEHPTRPLPEVQGYMGINRGTSDISKLYWITQQGTIMQRSPTALNARKVDWEQGSITVEASSGLFFSPRNVVRGQNVSMWLDIWMRHVTLQYIGVGHVHGLTVYKYRLADSSLEACATPTTSTRKLQAEGPCMYPNRYYGLINMSRFQSAVFQTLPHFYRADPRITKTLGLSAGAMQPNEAYEFTMDIEPSFGASVNLSFWFQKVFEVKRLTYLYEKLWISTDKTFQGSTWIPHSYYHIETTANKSVCDALAAGTSVLSAVVFLMGNVIPFCSVGCLICGLQCLWRRKKLTICYIVCIEGDSDEAPTSELVTAVVMDPKELQQVLKEERQVEQKQKEELSWRRFNEQMIQHTHREAEVTKQHAEHRRATIILAAREAAVKEAAAVAAAAAEAAAVAAASAEAAAMETALEDLAGDRVEESAQPVSEDLELQSTELQGDTGKPWDSARSVSLLEVENTLYPALDSSRKEEIPQLDSVKEEWARTASLIEAEGPVVRTHSLRPAQPLEQTTAASSTEAESSSSGQTRTDWSRTTSLIEASDSYSKATLEWSRTASLFEAWGPGAQSSRAWSRTFSTIEPESANVALTGWSRSASLVEAEESKLRWVYPRAARIGLKSPAPGLAVLSSISEDSPDQDHVE